LDNANDFNENCKAEDKADLEMDNGMEDPGIPELLIVSCTENVLRLIRPTQKSTKPGEHRLVMVNAIEIRSHKRIEQK